MPALTDPELAAALLGVPGWSIEAGELTRRFRFCDFTEAFGFIAQVATIQERLDHHATITNTYADVTLQVHTHDEGGITARDIEFARRVNERASGLGATR